MTQTDSFLQTRRWISRRLIGLSAIGGSPQQVTAYRQLAGALWAQDFDIEGDLRTYSGDKAYDGLVVKHAKRVSIEDQRYLSYKFETFQQLGRVEDVDPRWDTAFATVAVLLGWQNLQTSRIGI
jgi:hypothetical protein